jgi:regulation of enolase protein 1 (concanavalin A-like superfamily)
MKMRAAGIALACFSLAALAQQPKPVGLFEDHADVGENPKAGAVEFNAGSAEYRVGGGGANIWANTDAFHFAWKRISGDVTITANVQFIGQGAVAHRKAVLMVRQSLAADSAYADIALHGDGLTSLQFRPAAGAATQEMRSTISAPVRIRIERRGSQFTISAGKPGEQLTRTGPATVTLQDPVYVGIGVCSHDTNILETAVFSNVRIDTQPQQPPAPRYHSKITIYDLAAKSSRVVYAADEVFEAPNWSRDGKFLLSNSGGALYKIPVDGGGAQQKLDVGPDLRCNNDHDFSPDGKLLALSASSAASRGSQVYVVSAAGGAPRQLTTMAPSYFHGWSPDGKWMAIVAQRNNNFDLFRIPKDGGQE